jgi:DNA helicase HerA-like ATPase
VVPPGSQLGPISADERRKAIAASSVAGFYEKAVDRESAYEKLRGRAEAKQPDASSGPTAAAPESRPASSVLSDVLFGRTGPRGGQHDGLAQTLAKSVVRTMGSSVGREIVRGVLGSILGKRR